MALPECLSGSPYPENCTYAFPTKYLITPTDLPTSNVIESIAIATDSNLGVQAPATTINPVFTVSTVTVQSYNDTKTVVTTRSHVYTTTVHDTPPTSTATSLESPSTNQEALALGGTVAIAVAVPIVIIALLVSLFYWKRRRRQNPVTEVVELGTGGGGSYHELDVQRNAELGASSICIVPKYANSGMLIAELGTPTIASSTRRAASNNSQIDLGHPQDAVNLPLESEVSVGRPESLPMNDIQPSNILLNGVPIEEFETRPRPAIVNSRSIDFRTYIPYSVNRQLPSHNSSGDLSSGAEDSQEDGDEEMRWLMLERERIKERRERIRELEQLDKEEVDIQKRILQKKNQTQEV